MDAISADAEGNFQHIPSGLINTDAEIERILGCVPEDASFLMTPSALDAQRSFEVISKKQVTLELHFVTLREYYRAKRIPRGMRSSLQPTLFSQDQDFRGRFETLSNKYAADLILLNLEFLQRELGTVKN